MTIPLRLDPRGSLASDRSDRSGASLGRQVTTVAVVLGGPQDTMRVFLESLHRRGSYTFDLLS